MSTPKVQRKEFTTDVSESRRTVKSDGSMTPQALPGIDSIGVDFEPLGSSAPLPRLTLTPDQQSQNASPVEFLSTPSSPNLEGVRFDMLAPAAAPELGALPRYRSPMANLLRNQAGGSSMDTNQPGQPWRPPRTSQHDLSPEEQLRLEIRENMQVRERNEALMHEIEKTYNDLVAIRSTTHATQTEISNTRAVNNSLAQRLQEEQEKNAALKAKLGENSQKLS